MWGSSKLKNWVENFQQTKPLALRICLWSGKQFDLAPPGTPLHATLTLTRPQALKHLWQPTLSRLGEAYVTGDIDIDGDLFEVMDLAWAWVQAHHADEPTKRAYQYCADKPVEKNYLNPLNPKAVDYV